MASVKTQEVIDWYGSKAEVAKVLGIEAPSIYSWKEYPPALRQLQIEAMTKGKLRAEPDCLLPAMKEQAA